MMVILNVVAAAEEAAIATRQMSCWHLRMTRRLPLPTKPPASLQIAEEADGADKGRARI